ncbi:MAG: DNA repair protein RadC [Tenericutes bacterium]|nr:DNA repair protein RadC [Mycoplasmatota bacterium]
MNNIKFKDLPKNELPRERFIKYGVESLSNEELLSIILKTGTKNIPVNVVSLEILSSIKDITKLKDMKINNLTNIKGVGRVKAITLLASIELGRRIYNSNNNLKRYNIKNPIDIISYFNELLKDKKQEEFYVLYLDNKNNVIENKKLFVGTLNKSIVHPREIFKEAYILSSASIVCVHNHPSGNVTPSQEDISLTRKIHEIALIHEIKLLDHIIVGDNNYFSFYENKLLK